MRVLYLTQWCEPEPIAKGAEFARALRDAGVEVELVTGFPNYPTGKIYPGYRLGVFFREKLYDIACTRLFVYPSHDRSSIGRVLNYFSFFVSSFFYGLWSARRFDVVYAYHPPITTALSAAFFCWVWRRPLVVDIADLWPDSVAVSGMKGTRIIARMLDSVCNLVYSRATGLISPSVGIKACLVERGVPAEKIEVVHHWAPEDQLDADEAPDGDLALAADRFNFVYAGNIGRVQALDVLVRSMARVADAAPRAVLTLVGGGTEVDDLKALAGRTGAGDVRFIPAVPKSQIASLLENADVLVVSLAAEPVFEITVPSKVQFYLAMGKPILAVLSGEGADLVRRIGAGVAVEPGNEEAIGEAIVSMANASRAELEAVGERGRNYYRDHFTQAIGIARTIEVLRCACGQAPPGHQA